MSLDYYTRTEMSHQNRLYGDAQPVNGRTSKTQFDGTNMTANQLFSYRNQFGDMKRNGEALNRDNTH
ncbi:hypothetical protein [Persicobacter diffluens]|uniref:Uncharacterized protein n=1 Tax=Persicobacter diffluens TaxID=981 RepID=A0AAN4W1Z0_9BACT|nr:hypothetical protein PEDI_35820 [Persicobacter diffluens]